MISCPVCRSSLSETNEPGTNCFRCDTCDELVFAICLPNNPNLQYAAVSNFGSQIRNVPGDILLYTIVDQSPITDPPRNIIIEFGDGASLLIIQPLTDEMTYPIGTRKSLVKTASALKHNVLFVRLPIELMAQIRNSNGDQNRGITKR